ncbi:putative serine/threonine-protein kinase [Sesamum angolense]|uniref:Serine/threonine-protein kinase n=1 Tax=Sesamum angolense TaxID=2727404 RepID=A0AAE2C6F7_9LAMI|nr:putative serine/threonine-protein kinase [Sesamum angolense]
MGCVLGKRAAGKREARRKQKNDERRGSESATATVQDGGVVGRGEEKKIEEAPVAAVATAPAPAAAAVARPEFRLKRGVSAGGEGWPSWLNDVAGHAIKDWKPRRANTFEKLEKVKCYMKQLLSGLEHCHNNGVLHRDIKCSNLLIDSGGILRIADFGLASFFDPERRRPMTSRVITLWYRPPELLLGATYYGVSVDLWSAGCILAELLAGKPILRGRTEFFTTEPYACEPSSLPKFPPSKEMDIKLRGEEARRQRGLGAKPHVIDGNRRVRTRDKFSRAVPAPEANAELQTNLDRLRIMSDAKAKSKSDKFPPPHQDAAVGHPLDASQNGPMSFDAADTSFSSSIFDPKASRSLRTTTPKNGTSRRKNSKDEPQRAPTRSFINAFHPSSVGWDFRFGRRRTISENFSERR